MKTTKAKSIEVLVNYEGKYYPKLDEKLATTARTYGGKTGDSGYSFLDNSRDIFFKFKDPNKGIEFMTKIRHLKGINFAESHGNEE